MADQKLTELTTVTPAANDLLYVVDVTDTSSKKATVQGVLDLVPATAWGDVTGTLSDQTDLQSALDLKAPLNSPTLVTPNIGAATAASVNGVTVTNGGSGALTVTGTASVSGANTGDQDLSGYATTSSLGPLATAAADTSGLYVFDDGDSLVFASGSGLQNYFLAGDNGNGRPGFVQVAWSDLTGTPTTLSGYGITDAQPLDADLTALAALTGTDTIYYRSAADTWTAVTIGTGLSFTSGTLATTGGGGGTPTAITVADESADTTCFPLFVTAATGDLGPKTNSGLAFNSSTGVLTATGFSGPLTGNVTGNVTGSSGSTTGNAATATALETARTINGTSFDGTANITVTAAAGTLTGTTLNATVVTSSLTSVGTLTGGATGAGFTVALGASTITGILGAANGGTGNGFTAFSGPATSTKTFTLPNANATLLYDGGPGGTPSSLTLTNGTGLPIASGVSGLGTGVATFLATPSSANLASAVTDETGSGALVFATSPTLVTPALGTPTSGTLTNCTGLPTAGLVDSAVTPAKLSTAAKTKTITVTIGDGTSVPTVGTQCWLVVPVSGTITQATLLADATGSAVIDVWKDSYANYPPTDADSITASAPPTLSSANKSQDATLTGWTTSITAGDVLVFNLDSVSTCTKLTLVLEMTLS